MLEQQGRRNFIQIRTGAEVVVVVVVAELPEDRRLLNTWSNIATDVDILGDACSIPSPVTSAADTVADTAASAASSSEKSLLGVSSAVSMSPIARSVGSGAKVSVETTDGRLLMCVLRSLLSFTACCSLSLQP